jgi:hypothetical protein
MRWIGLVLALGMLCGAARAGDGGGALRAALTLARDGDYREAARALPEMETLDRTDLLLMGRVGAALEEQEPDAALRLFAAMRRLDADGVAPRIALERMWALRPLPATLAAADVPFFPVQAGMLDLPAGKGVPAAEIVTLAPKAFLAVPAAREPRSGTMYPRAVGVYAREGETLRMRFTVHFAADAMAARARQAGRWLGALSLLSDRMLGAASRARYPVSVWLSPDGRPGAETWNGSITVHAAGADRSALEWVRQLSHEWGHAAIPGGGGFARPEAWAAGDLGERLFLPAMRDAGWLRAWDDSLDVEPYVQRYVEPVRAAIARTGPVQRLVTGTDEAAYDHYLGACLYMEAAYGMPLFAATMNDLDGPRTADLLAAFSRSLAARNAWDVVRVAGVDGPLAVCFPERGRYMLEAHGPDGHPAPPAGPKTFAAGWVRMDWPGVLIVRRLSGTEKG